jgi:hypothetical protein
MRYINIPSLVSMTAKRLRSVALRCVVQYLRQSAHMLFVKKDVPLKSIAESSGSLK